MVVSTVRARRRTWRAMERRSALGDPPAALVTGAGGGIGAAIATALGQLGWRLTLADIDEDRVGAVAEALRARGVEVTTAVVDLSTIAGQAAAVDARVAPLTRRLQRRAPAAGTRRRGSTARPG